MNYMQIESTFSSGVYLKRPLTLVRGDGVFVYDVNGHRYFDATSGLGVGILGHNHPLWIRALTRQMHRLSVCCETFYTEQRALLLEKLQSILPGNDSWRIFLCNSGAEAVEAGIKFARLHTGRIKIVAMENGFHGRTMGALSATWNPDYRRPFEPLVPGFVHIPFNHIHALEREVDSDTAGVILEVIQGEGGVHPASRDFLTAARSICDQMGSLLIVDEIQTGFGRTGQWFAFEHFDFIPDLIIMGKGMGGGFPVGAVAFPAKWGPMQSRAHGSTFGGNPLACSAVLATIEVMEQENLVKRVREYGQVLISRLSDIHSPLVREIRGMGLMIGVEMRIRAYPVLQRLADYGVLALLAGKRVIRLLPPYVLDESHIEFLSSAFASALSDVEGTLRNDSNRERMTATE